MNLADFVYKWKRVETSEARAAKEHYLDLCALLGETTPNASDYEGANYNTEVELKPRFFAFLLKFLEQFQRTLPPRCDLGQS